MISYRAGLLLFSVCLSVRFVGYASWFKQQMQMKWNLLHPAASTVDNLAVTNGRVQTAGNISIVSRQNVLISHVTSQPLKLVIFFIFFICFLHPWLSTLKFNYQHNYLPYWELKYQTSNVFISCHLASYLIVLYYWHCYVTLCYEANKSLPYLCTYQKFLQTSFLLAAGSGVTLIYWWGSLCSVSR